MVRIDRPATWGDLATLSSPAGRRRMPALGALTLVERLLAPLTTWALVGGTFGEKLALGSVLGVTFVVRTLVQKVGVARAEADLLERTTASVLHGDVLADNLLPDEDARLELAQAISNAAIALGQTLPNVLADAVACVVLGAVVTVVEPARVVLFAVALMLVCGAALLVARGWVNRELERSWALHHRVNDMFWDALEGRLEIAASGRRAAFMTELRSRTEALGAAGVKLATATTLSARLPWVAVAVVAALAFAAGVRMPGSLAVNLTDAALLASVTPAFAGLAQGLHGLSSARRWTRVVARVVTRPDPERSGTKAPPSLPSPVVFDRVSFRYEMSTEGYAIEDASFAWSGKGPLALAGANGSGKSTCLRLLLGLAPPTRGSVVVGGVPVEQLDVDDWRRTIAFLPQRPYLPPRADVRAAVRWLAPDADDARILRSLDRVGLLASLHRESSKALDARVDSLSVGQRQRVALARLLCRDASLFLLDEPDANLDRGGIALVADILRELAGRGLVVFVAHTPELLEVADRVVTLQGGRVLRDESRDRAARAG
jgi:ABC-type transport system involved in cytochrome bd biosynthesis fused ATPase/permease subunit